jgi:hypothetical protein
MQRMSITRKEIEQVDESNWYKYTLECGHEFFTRVRIRIPKDYGFMENFIRCIKPHEKKPPTQWIPITGMEAVSDDLVRNVSDGFAFIVPGRIMRTSAGNPSGDPFPYSNHRERDY